MEIYPTSYLSIIPDDIDYAKGVFFRDYNSIDDNGKEKNVDNDCAIDIYTLLYNMTGWSITYAPITKTYEFDLNENMMSEDIWREIDSIILDYFI